MTRPTCHLVVFVRAPRFGQVKSRLAAGLGSLGALRFHRESTRLLLRRVAADRRWRLYLGVTPSADRHGRFWSLAFRRLDQGNGDLGRRMAHMFHTLPPGPAVIVGSDIPEITASHIAAAFRALGRHDAVFGPARDGGYWLVGLKRRPHLPVPLFANVRWSSPHALADTMAGLPPRWSAAFLETLDDIDDAEGYWRWRERVSRR